MKKLLLILLCLPMIGFGQVDKIIFSSGDTIYGKVIEVGVNDITFQYKDETTNNISKKRELAKVIYSSGRTEAFEGLKILEAKMKREENNKLYQQQKEEQNKIRIQQKADIIQQRADFKKSLYLIEESNIIEIHLLNLIFSELHLTYEKVLNEKFSVKIGVPIFIKQDIAKIAQRYNFGNEISNREFEEFEDLGYLSGFGIIPEFRYYFSRKGAPAGFYLSSQVIFRQFSVDIDADSRHFDNDGGPDDVQEAEANSKLNIRGIGFLIGKHWILNSFTIDLNIGIATYTAKSKWESTIRYFDGSIEKEKDSEDIEDIEGYWGPKIGLSVGFVF